MKKIVQNNTLSLQRNKENEYKLLIIIKPVSS